MLRDKRPHGPAYLDKPLDFEDVVSHRNMSCGLYGICLEVVVKRRWPSFSCCQCSLWPSKVLPFTRVESATVLPLPLAKER